MIRIFTLFLLGVCAVQAEVLQNGPCPNVRSSPNITHFSLNKLMGVWYEQMHTKRWSGMELTCTTLLFTKNSATNFTSEQFSFSPTVNREFYEASDVIIKPHINGSKANFVFDYGDDNEKSNVFLLGSDYKNYATIWSCTPVPDDMHIEHVMVLTRQRVAKREVVTQAVTVLHANNLSSRYITYKNHVACPDFLGENDDNKNSTTTSTSKQTPMMTTAKPVSPTITIKATAASTAKP